MTDYTKTTDFTSKDSLPSGDSGKIIRGAEFGTEFDNIQTAVNSKSNIDNPSFTGNITVTGTVDGRDIAADGIKLDTVETNADVTDTTNVTAAGALMDSEVTNLAQVKAFDSADYATAAQGTTADNALPKTGGAMTGAITTNSTFDGRDVATDGIKLDGIEASADVTDTANVTAAGALMDSELTSEASVKALNQGVATTDSPTFAGVTANGTVEFDGLSGTGAVTVTDILDQDDMSGNSATALATQQSIKAYVDSQVGTVDTLAEVLANGNATGGTDIAFGDNDKAVFGTGNDLQLYHDGLNSYIDDSGTGNLLIRADSLQLQRASGAQLFLAANTGAEVALYHAGNPKLSTTSTGIDVTGTATMDGLTVDGNATISDATTAKLELNRNGAIGNGWIVSTDNAANEEVAIQMYNSEFRLYNNGAQNFTVTSNGLVGIGTDSPDQELHVSASATPVIRIESKNNSLGVNESIGSLEFEKLDASGGGAGVASSINCFTTDLGGAVALSFQTGSSSGNNVERMRITSDGLVGIGTDTPTSNYAKVLHIHNTATGSSLHLTDGTSGSGANDGTDFLHYGNDSYIINRESSGTMRFLTGGTEACRIDSSQNLLVGRTSASGVDTDGHVLFANGVSYQSMTDNAAQFVNRNGTGDGPITSFYKNGNSVGSLGVNSTTPYMSGNLGGFRLTSSAGAGVIIPTDTSGNASDADNDLGISSARWRDLYLSNKVYASYIGAGGDTDTYMRFAGSDQILLATGGTEACRIDSSQNLLVSKSAIGTGTVGAELRANGFNAFVRDGGEVMNINRLSSDGTLVDFRKDSLTVGSIGTEGGDLTIGTGDVGLKFNDGASLISPWDTTANAPEDGLFDLGYANGRFKDLYLSGGVVFGATGGSVSSKTLDDYEEGTFTPIVKGATSDGTATYSYQVGEYTKVGRHVTVQVYISWTSGTGTGALQISGLPFSSLSGSGRYNSPSYGEVSNIPYTAGRTLGGLVGASTTILNVTQSAPSAAPLVVPYVSSGYLIFNLTYIAA